MRLGALAIALGAFGLSCAGPGTIDVHQLPAQPIAVLYRDEKASLDRVDAIGDAEKRQTPGEEEGVVRLETLDAVFGGSPTLMRRLTNTEGRLSLVDPATGGAKHLEGVPPSAKPIVWSPDRTKLLLSGYWRGLLQLFVWDRGTETTEIRTSGTVDHPLGCFGSDGRLVVVEATRTPTGYDAHLVTTPPGGGPPRRLSPGRWDISPACSPTAPLVAYVTREEERESTERARSEHPEPPRTEEMLLIAVIAVDDPDAKPRVFGRGIDPVFTPDGAWVVYAAKTVKGLRLARMRPDGSGRAPIGGGPDEESHPAMSPDGRYVAYVTTDPTKRERLRVRRFPDGSGDRPLVETGDATMPVW
jgi:dipeptidyl aminopeptidase/acylaminoacyl peptidase